MPELGVVVRVLGKALHGFGHVEQAHGIGVVHGATAPEREAVTGDVDHVDVAGLAGDAFFQDVAGFVDQGIHQALHDLVIGNLAGRDALRSAVLLDHLDHHGARDRVALAGLVVVPACASLLAIAAHLAEQVSGLAVLHAGLFLVAALANRPADVVTGQIAHAELAHGKTEFLDRFVHLSRGAAFFDQVKGERWTPYVIEPAAGLTRSLMAFLVDAYHEDEAPNTKGGVDVRTVLKLDYRLAPVKAAILPLSRNEDLSPVARNLAQDLRGYWNIDFDDSGAIGRRYRRQDEIGTPFCVTVDFETLDDQAVTVRERDTMQQERVSLSKVREYLAVKLVS